VTEQAFAQWVILELMGHRRLAGYLTEQEIGGQAFLRLDVPAADGQGHAATQFYSASAVYCITPTTEDLARRVAAGADPAPVKRWELPAPARDEDDVEDEDEVDQPAMFVGPEFD
jgi:hypothetical protein